MMVEDDPEYRGDTNGEGLDQTRVVTDSVYLKGGWTQDGRLIGYWTKYNYTINGEDTTNASSETVRHQINKVTWK
jgi:hypothetical protein